MQLGQAGRQQSQELLRRLEAGEIHEVHPEGIGDGTVELLHGDEAVIAHHLGKMLSGAPYFIGDFLDLTLFHQSLLHENLEHLFSDHGCILVVNAVCAAAGRR